MKITSWPFTIYSQEPSRSW